MNQAVALRERESTRDPASEPGSSSQRFASSTRMLGMIGMLGSPMMLLEGILRVNFGDSDLDFLMGLGGLIYILAWMCSAVGLRQLRATGDTWFSRTVFAVQMAGLTLAAVWTGQYVVSSNVDTGTVLWKVTDLAWPFSHLFMLVVGSLVIATNRLRGWRRFPALVTGLALPAFYGLAAVGAAEIIAGASFGVLTTLGFLSLGYVVHTAEPRVDPGLRETIHPMPIGC